MWLHAIPLAASGCSIAYHQLSPGLYLLLTTLRTAAMCSVRCREISCHVAFAYNHRCLRSTCVDDGDRTPASNHRHHHHRRQLVQPHHWRHGTRIYRYIIVVITCCRRVAKCPALSITVVPQPLLPRLPLRPPLAATQVVSGSSLLMDNWSMSVGYNHRVLYTSMLLYRSPSSSVGRSSFRHVFRPFDDKSAARLWQQLACHC